MSKKTTKKAAIKKCTALQGTKVSGPIAVLGEVKAAAAARWAKLEADIRANGSRDDSEGSVINQTRSFVSNKILGASCVEDIFDDLTWEIFNRSNSLAHSSLINNPTDLSLRHRKQDAMLVIIFNALHATATNARNEAEKPADKEA